ncbi:MAG TPA: ABC transporter ATP-binding protein [Syntrophomonadaceae bacterium]|nr:ABC transporter ATP-binding protein [Syntrophomonadaceae bacterium]HQA07164.1 ABC transporter ATP-binding protein [Syntrophomonadaceae bacterium]HQE24062.1 ABC transporter ATP-binding protein [Syntrophomonadaceae bacterium]
MQPLLEVRDISFQYPGSLILDKVKFDLNAGEVVCLLGPNGCGKTTLLDCILGWLKPCEGQVFVNGQELTNMPARKIARYLAYVPQIHEKTFPYLVRDVVLMGRASYLGPFERPSDEDRKIADRALEMVGIAHLKKRPYTQLSGGEGQLVMVARALAQNTPVIVMDEPTAHLDCKHEIIVLETIAELIKKTHLSVLMATHVPNHCYYFENKGIPIRAALIKNRSIMAMGQPSEVLTEENLGRLYNIHTRVIDCNMGNGVIIKQVVSIGTLPTISAGQGG